MNSPADSGTVAMIRSRSTDVVYLGVDTGGTFTDFVAVRDDGATLVSFKVPSVPEDPARAVSHGLARLERLGIPAEQVTRIVFGTTVATNAVLESKGARTALIATRGTRDVIEIRRLWRERLFDLYITRPPPLVPRRWRYEVDERVGADGSVVLELEDAEATRVAEQVAAGGFEAVAVCCLFSFLAPAHEQRLREALSRYCPGVPVSLSAEVSPQFREFERASTTVMNAYVTPVVERLMSRLDDMLADSGCTAGLRVMQSNGGHMTASTTRRFPVRTLLSGPAGGVVGAQRLATAAGFPDVITMDMGGTSLDISVVQEGRTGLGSEGRIGPHPVQVPQVDVHTIGAGGGSIARCVRGALKVGPDSAGAVPGPACYGRGGEAATSTDAAVVLGYIDPEGFADAQMRLDAEAARGAIRAAIAEPLGMSIEAAAEAVVAVQVANMVTGIRAVTVERGLDARDFTLLPFGGAGALYACRVAEHLGIGTLMIPAQPGVLSALGMLLADVTHTAVRTRLMEAASVDAGDIEQVLDALRDELLELLREDTTDVNEVRFEFLADMRYRGQAYEVPVPIDAAGNCDPERLRGDFHRRHGELYGQSAPDEAVEIVNLRAIARIATPRPGIQGAPATGDNRPVAQRPTHHAPHGWLDTPVYRRGDLASDALLHGPAIVEDPGATVVLPPGHRLRVHDAGHLVIQATPEEAMQ